MEFRVILRIFPRRSLLKKIEFYRERGVEEDLQKRSGRNEHWRKAVRPRSREPLEMELKFRHREGQADRRLHGLLRTSLDIRARLPGIRRKLRRFYRIEMKSTLCLKRRWETHRRQERQRRVPVREVTAVISTMLFTPWRRTWSVARQSLRRVPRQHLLFQQPRR